MKRFQVEGYTITDIEDEVSISKVSGNDVLEIKATWLREETCDSVAIHAVSIREAELLLKLLKDFVGQR